MVTEIVWFSIKRLQICLEQEIHRGATSGKSSLTSALGLVWIVLIVPSGFPEISLLSWSCFPFFNERFYTKKV